MKSLLEDGQEDVEATTAFKINHDFAKKYEQKKRKEEISQRMISFL